MQTICKTYSMAIYTAIIVSVWSIGAGDSHCYAQSVEVSRSEMAAIKKLEVMQQLDIRIEELTSVCGIGEAKTRKLKVAAKRVAERESQKWVGRMDEMDVFGPAKEEEVRIEDINLKNLPPLVTHYLNTNNTSTSKISDGPTHDKFWKQAVDSILDNEQQIEFDAYRKAKNEKVVEATIEFVTEIYGAQMNLSEIKRTELAKLIKQTFKSSPAPQNKRGALDDFYLSTRRIPKRKFVKIFNQTEMISWKLIMGDYAYSLSDEAVGEDSAPENGADENNSGQKDDG